LEGIILDNKNKIAGSIVALVSVLAAFAFLFIGFTQGIWHPTWLVFLIIPIVSMIADIATKKKDPVGLVSSIVSTLCVLGFLYMGFFLGLWHPGWLIFFAIPIASIITKMFVGDTPPAKKDEDTKA
jgi:hypothetical protein